VPERPEILSTARPTALRLWGFALTAGGALLAGIGASQDWAVLGFTGDRLGALDVAVKGTDVWEGMIVLTAAVIALIGIVVLRLLGGTDARRALALAVVSLGALVMALAISIAIRADERFAGGESLDEIAVTLSEQLDTDVAEVRAQLREEFGTELRVDIGPGVWLTLLGGASIVVGGSLSLFWTRAGVDHETEPPGPGPSDPS
jgi:hypothetical protein